MKRFILFIIFCLSLSLNAKDINISTSILVTSNSMKLQDIEKSDEFKILKQNHVNLGFSTKKTVWLKIELENTSNEILKKYLVIDNPLLEKVFFFNSENNFRVYKSGMLHISKDREEIFPSYVITVKPGKRNLTYIKIQNSTTTLQFGFHLKNEKTFKKENKIKEFSIVLFIGLLSTFVIYSLFLYMYTKDKSYYLYSFYLIALMFQQLTYIGFLPLYAPFSFVYIDNLIVVPKVALVIVTGVLFAREFLKMEEFPRLNKIYKYIIIVVVLQMPVFGTKLFYMPEVTVFIGLLFIIFNTYSGIYVYLSGNRQARFFIVGWSFLFIGYFLMIFDALGILSIMHNFPELILWITVIEALFLMLAFVDKLSILTSQKNVLDKKLFQELDNRQKIIKKEVVQRTNELQMALEEKVVLFRELHHRVKNNLQLILSIIRLQRFDLKNQQSSHEFEKLENRIKAISKTHEILCDSNDIVEINMDEYINELCEDVSDSIIDKDIKINLQIEAKMLLSQAVYVGLIINELISNSIKHAFIKNKGTIFISLCQEKDEYILSVGDSGQGYDINLVNQDNLGLKLVKSLVVKQLDGSIKINKEETFKHIIKFK